MIGLHLCRRLLLVDVVIALTLIASANADAQSNGPGAAYAFSEGTGTTTADGSGNGNTGTLVGGPAWTTGYFGNGLTFDGTSGAVQVPTSETLAAISVAFTVEAWVRPTDVSAFRAIVNRRDAAINLYLNPGGVPQIAAVLNGTEIDVTAPTAVPLNAWTHVAATYDGTTIRLYVNGSQVASAAATGAVEASTSRFEIGSPFWSVFAGTLDEVRLYGRALSAIEVRLDQITPIDGAAPFQVSAHTPVDQAVGILTTPITVGFSRAADPTSVTTTTVEVRDSANALVAATVSYDATTHTATLTPTTALQPLTEYIVKVGSGSTGVKDGSGTALAADVTWTFRTATAVTAPVAAYAFSAHVPGLIPPPFRR